MTLRAAVSKILSNRLHTHFTDHSVDHSDRVAQIASQLAQALSTERRLTPDEAFVLYGACYLHDIGMHNEAAGSFGRLKQRLDDSKRNWADIPREERLELIRLHHHEISADMVMQSLQSGLPLIGLSLDSHDFATEIACVAEAHCVDFNSERYAQLTRGAERLGMRLRLLAAFLRLSDILDETQHRALVEQARTLELNPVSRMHWWRHYYTRDVGIDKSSNRIVIRFVFPASERAEYTQIIPPLQIPWIEQELANQRGVLAENGLSWHVEWTVDKSPFDSALPMPPEVKGLVLRTISDRKREASERARLDVLRHFEEASSHVYHQLSTLTQRRDEMSPDDYLSQALKLARELWGLGSWSVARYNLHSDLHYASTNGRTVSPTLQVEAVIELGTMWEELSLFRDAAREMTDASHVAQHLPDTSPHKLAFFRRLASVCLRAGFFPDGEAAVREVTRLQPGQSLDETRAEYVEARFLEGELSDR